MTPAEYISIAAVFLSAGAFFTSIIFTINQNRVLYWSKCAILIDNLEDCIGLKLKNCGNGPLEIINVKFISEGKEITNIINHLPVDNYAFYVTQFRSRFMNAGDEILIFSITDPNELTDENKYKIRKALMNVTVRVDYTNIYNSKQKKSVRELSFFGEQL